MCLKSFLLLFDHLWYVLDLLLHCVQYYGVFGCLGLCTTVDVEMNRRIWRIWAHIRPWRSIHRWAVIAFLSNHSQVLQVFKLRFLRSLACPCSSGFWNTSLLRNGQNYRLGPINIVKFDTEWLLIDILQLTHTNSDYNTWSS